MNAIINFCALRVHFAFDFNHNVSFTFNIKGVKLIKHF